MTDAVVLTSTNGPAFTITLNRPDKRNALNDAVVEGVRRALAEAQADPSVRVIVLTGAGEKAFCAGGDLGSGSKAFAFDTSQPSNAYAALLREAMGCTLPMIARVNGHCMAGGFGLFAVCDVAVAAESAKFGLPEAKVGVFPMQVLAVLKPLIGGRRLAELCLTADPIDAAAARDWGLVNEVVASAELDEAVERWVARFAANSPTALRRGKYALRAAADMTFEQALAYLELQLPTLVATQDAREGMASFNEKRAPVWTGR